MNIKQLLDEENFLNIIRLVEKRRLSLFRTLSRNGISFPTKTKSELVSQLFESALYNYFQEKDINIERAGSDSLKPDILFTDTETPLEIKTTKGDYWIGGSYSKREGDFLLISWDDSGKQPNYFVSHVKLNKEDWASQGDNFYGTKFTKKDLSKKDTTTILMGELAEKNGRVKLIKESIKEMVKRK